MIQFRNMGKFMENMKYTLNAVKEDLYNNDFPQKNFILTSILHIVI